MTKRRLILTLFHSHFQNSELCPRVYKILYTACFMDITAFLNNVSGHYKLEMNALPFLPNFDNPVEER